MKILDKNYEIEIDEDDIKDARLSSIDFEDEKTKKRAFANILGARLAMKFLFSQEIEANNLYSLYTIHNLLQELDIADIYYKGIKIDIRLVFNSGEIFVPKSHFQYNLVPDVYLVLGLADDMSAVECLGFFEPSSLNKKNENQNYYFFEKPALKHPEEFLNFLDNFKTEPIQDISEEAIEKAKEWFLSLTDKEISPADKRIFFKQLSNSAILREKMVEFENFEFISKAVAKSDELLQDSILDIVGTQQVVDKEELTHAEFKEELAQAIGKEAPKSSKMGLDSLIAEAEAEKNLTPTQEEKHDSSTGAIIAGGLGVAAAGLALGTVVAANEANTASAGIALGSEIVNQGAKVISSGLEGLNNIIDEHKLEELPESIKDLDNFTDSEEKISLDEAEPTLIEDLNENTSETLEKFEELGDLEALPPLEDSFEEVELEKFEELEEPESIETLETLENNEIQEAQEEESESQDEEESLEDDEENVSETLQDTSESTDETPEVLNLDDFDFDLLDNLSENTSNDEEASSDNLVSFEDISNETDEESQKLNELRELEASEDGMEEFETLPESIDNESIAIEDNAEDLMSKVDEFLESAELSDEDNNVLEQELDVDLEDTTDEIPVTAEEEITFIDKVEPEVIDETDSLKVLFAQEMEENWKNDAQQVPEGLASTIKTNWSTLSQNNKKMVIAASLSGIIITSMIVGSAAIHHKTVATNNQSAPIAADGSAATDATQNPAEMDLATTNDPTSQPIDQLEQPTSALGAAPQASAAPRDMGQAVSDAFLSEPVSANISKVAWEVPEDLAYNDSFRQYLQVAGKNLKLNLQNNLLLATEMAYANKIVVDLEINKNGAIQASNVVASSGSKQIDKIVLQSIKETLKYLKMPSSEIQGQYVVATLIINF